MLLSFGWDCLCDGLLQLFDFGFLPLKIQLKEKTKAKCCK
jgi:hypothetical protein